MLVRLLYASRAAAPLTAAVMDSILAQSRKNNAPHGITGMLCFSEEIFLQVLEGGRDEVCELFNTIVRDPRNGGARILSYEEIAERRLPQDGRISMRAAGAEIDVRVSSIPAVYGESIVMRLLPKQRQDLRLEALG